MSVHSVAKLVPSAVLRRVADRPTFLDDVARYVAMSDDDLFRATEVCLRNLDRLGDLAVAGPDPDNDLRIVLVPEFWERIRPGTRDGLRRISSTLAEYRPDGCGEPRRQIARRAGPVCDRRLVRG